LEEGLSRPPIAAGIFIALTGIFEQNWDFPANIASPTAELLATCSIRSGAGVKPG
jgi:hypothetical protein